MAEHILAIWQQHMRAGNECFEAHQDLAALSHYNQAIELANSLLIEYEDIRAAVAAVIVSYHNLADVYLREHEYALAETQLRTVHQKMSLALKQAKPNSAQTEALLWGVNKTYFALISHKKNHTDSVISAPVSVPDINETHYKNSLN